ncbi:hypothetical protein CMV_020051 [Castanea mollissima]|uniref:Uncharacterized protein n=1 Tax=Castanea mollissima TaxID=60419 RepID=A0A8J4QNU3_9ROSI|nr:hypothetical protein CMV_020051 [Castanea mollissima]
MNLLPPEFSLPLGVYLVSLKKEFGTDSKFMSTFNSNHSSKLIKALSHVLQMRRSSNNCAKHRGKKLRYLLLPETSF